MHGCCILNGAVYYIDWIDPQLGSATVNANIPITVNGEGASATGVELSSTWQVNDALNLQAAFSYIDAQLTDPVPDLIRLIEPPGFSSGFDDGEDGDRLPGSPETQFSIFGSYDRPLSNGNNLNFSAGYVWQGGTFTISTAGKGNSHVLDSYGTANLSLAYEADKWTATLFANNLFDEFAETGSIGGPDFNQTVTDNNGDTVYTRSFHTHILPPRAIGVRVNYRFDQN